MKLAITRHELLQINQQGWDIVAPRFYAGTALPVYGPLAATEDELHLIDDLAGKAALEIGCGSGHSLLYLWQQRHAAELWGLDLSPQQLQFSRDLLAKENIPVRLFQASMDENPGIPAAYFDLVLAIYSLGWSPDLLATLRLIYAYLKPGGTLVLSWEHPVYHCLEYDPPSGRYFVSSPYLDETPLHLPSWNGAEIVLQPRKLATLVNGLAEAGFFIEHIVESDVNAPSVREKVFAPEKWYSVPRAQLVPTTLIVKARRPAHPGIQE